MALSVNPTFRQGLVVLLDDKILERLRVLPSAGRQIRIGTI